VRIVIAGGSGLLGTALVRELTRDGVAVTVLTRRPRQTQQVRWDPYGPTASEWAHALDGADAVVNLVGASINRRWTPAYKRELWDSRVRATRTLVVAMKGVRRTPPVFVSGSAVGIYGDRGEDPVTEQTPPASDFLASLGAQWENEALAARPAARVVVLRSGIVLDRDAGALPRMALPFRLFCGGRLGSGRQYISWIHRDDWTSMVRWALANEAVTGPINATAPSPVTNLEFARTLGRVLRRPAIVPAPAFALRLVLGEMADVVLGGQRVMPAKAQALGFAFQYPVLEGALRAIYTRRGP
jgi:uncharacterized protein (TIGR01777 family)